MLKCSAESGPKGGLVIYERFLSGKVEEESKVYNYTKSVNRKRDVGKVFGMRFLFYLAQETQQRCTETKYKWLVTFNHRYNRGSETGSCTGKHLKWHLDK